MYAFIKKLLKDLFQKDKKLSEEAYLYIKKNKKEIIQDTVKDKISLPKNEESMAIFMAGSPGAGKTEFSKNFIKIFDKESNVFVRIDADEIREKIPMYKGANAHLVQGAAVKGVEILFDYVTSTKNYNFILDGTFANFAVSKKNIERVINKNRIVEIWYVYQDSIKAWDFTKKREALEGRRVRKEDFINAFFASRKNVNLIKKEFPSVRLHLAIKDSDNIGVERFEINVQSIDPYLKESYTKESLLKLLKK